MTESTENKHEQELAAIAASIMEHAQAADDSVLHAAKEIAEAKARIERGEFGPLKWSHWSSEHLKLAPTRIRELLKIGEAKDPAAELRRQRGQNRARQKLHRTKTAAAASASRRLTAAPADAALRNAADELAAWAAQAPEEQVLQVLAFVKTLGVAPAR